jgi:hypothetical protein
MTTRRPYSTFRFEVRQVFVEGVNPPYPIKFLNECCTAMRETFNPAALASFAT